ncbi:MAG: polysaccharide deacetylase family protein [Kiloniellales bacterium]
MSGWQTLHRELEAWRESGRAATFWWRDDDAVDGGPALDRLLDLAEQHRAPLSLAVIPARATAALALRLEGAAAHVSVLQHGFDHANHAPEGEKSMELGPHRPCVAICEELAGGQAMLKAKFGKQAVPVLVPPWNRIADEFVPVLAGLGFRGLSAHTARTALRPAEGLVACNTHVDVMRWRLERGFLGENEALNLLIGNLRARRRAKVESPADGPCRAEPDEPSGLLTHHLVMDDAAWSFVARLLAMLSDHPAARWITADEAFHLSAAPCVDS